MRRTLKALSLALVSITIAHSGAGLNTDEDTGQPIGSAAISTGNTNLVVSGTQTGPRTEPGNTFPVFDPDARPWYPPQEFDFDSCLDNWNSYLNCFRATEESEPEEDDQPVVPAITINDLAQFAPEPVMPTGEPDNLGVAGMPTNFVAPAAAHTRAGTLFGMPLTVRFIPVGFDFRYGDGHTATTSTGGQTWSALGQASFTPTETSHTYRERGTYEAAVSVRYSAEVDLGIGWFPVTGQLSIDGPPQVIRIYEAHTALVARTCIEQPAAPGC